MKSIHSVLNPYYVAFIRDTDDDYWQCVLDQHGVVDLEKITKPEDVKQYTREQVKHIRETVLGWDADVWPSYLKQGTLEFLCVAPHSFVINQDLHIGRVRSSFKPIVR